MAHSSPHEVFESSNHVNRTPCIPHSSFTEKRCSHFDDDSGYFSELKLKSATHSFAEEHVVCPQLNLNISEQKTEPLCDHDRTQPNTCAVLSDCTADCTDQSLVDVIEDSDTEDTGCGCQSRLSDETSICLFSSVRQLAAIEYSDILHSSHDTVCEKDTSIIHEWPDHVSSASHVDFISRLFCMPHVLAIILHHVSDSDLCR